MHTALHGRPRPRVTDPDVLLGAALKAWWNADDLSDGAVTTWADGIATLSPTQGTADARPVRASTSFNGRAGVTFDGTDDYLRVDSIDGAGGDPLPSGSTPGEVWASYTRTATGTQVITRYGGATTGLRSLQTGGTAGGGVVTDAASNALFPGPAVGLPNFAGGIFEATQYHGRSSGVAALPVYGATLNTSTTRTTLGASNANTAATFFTGVIRHILVTTLLTEQQRLALEGWLAYEGGMQHLLPSYHPYRWASGYAVAAAVVVSEIPTYHIYGF